MVKHDHNPGSCLGETIKVEAARLLKLKCALRCIDRLPLRTSSSKGFDRGGSLNITRSWRIEITSGDHYRIREPLWASRK